MPDSIILLLIIAAIIAACFAYDLTRWALRNKYRKLERRAHLNITRAGQR
jgi:uncharacterized membrane protein YdjX (TVP38/TMEM64 family)